MIKSKKRVELPLEFIVVGEHRREVGRLLLQGDDGQYYEFRKQSYEVIPVVPGREWNVETESIPNLDLYVA